MENQISDLFRTTFRRFMGRFQSLSGSNHCFVDLTHIFLVYAVLVFANENCAKPLNESVEFPGNREL